MLRVSGNPYLGASPLKDEIVFPDPVQLPDSFPITDLAETALEVNAHTAFIFGEDPGLKGPESRFLTGFDQL